MHQMEGIFFSLSPRPQVLRFYFALSFFTLPAAPGALVHRAATVRSSGLLLGFIFRTTMDLWLDSSFHREDGAGLLQAGEFFPHTSPR